MLTTCSVVNDTIPLERLWARLHKIVAIAIKVPVDDPKGHQLLEMAVDSPSEKLSYIFIKSSSWSDFQFSIFSD